MDQKISTGLKYTFLAHAIMMGMFALVYLFLPVLWGNLTGCLSNKVPQVFRLFGTSLLGYAIGSALAYRETAWENVKIWTQMACITHIVFLVIILLALLFWELPTIGWMYFVVITGFGIAFNIFYPHKVEQSR
jgi:uncharacterized membrane protein AbrB (regulator of aidB expression)